MLEHLMENALNVTCLADDEARLMKRSYIGTEHLLLALIGASRGFAWTSFIELGITLRETRAQTKLIAGTGAARFEGELRYSPAARKALEVARRVSVVFADAHLDSEHILLALMHNKYCVAFAVLTAMNVDLQRLHDLVLLKKGLSDPTFWERLPSRRASVDEILRSAPGEGWNQNATELSDTMPEATSVKRALGPELHGPSESGLASEKAPPDAEVKPPSVFVPHAAGGRTTFACPNCAEFVSTGANVCRYCSYGLSDYHFFACRYCAERIRKGAIKCRYCQSHVDNPDI